MSVGVSESVQPISRGGRDLHADRETGYCVATAPVRRPRLAYRHDPGRDM